MIAIGPASLNSKCQRYRKSLENEIFYAFSLWGATKGSPLVGKSQTLLNFYFVIMCILRPITYFSYFMHCYLVCYICLLVVPWTVDLAWRPTSTYCYCNYVRDTARPPRREINIRTYTSLRLCSHYQVCWFQMSWKSVKACGRNYCEKYRRNTEHSSQNKDL